MTLEELLTMRANALAAGPDYLAQYPKLLPLLDDRIASERAKLEAEAAYDPDADPALTAKIQRYIQEGRLLEEGTMNFMYP